MFIAHAGSVVTVNGDFTQGASGKISVEIAGTSASQYGRIVVTGSATLNGTLNVTRVGGFEPSFGDTFQILTYGSRSGTFATVTGTDLGGGKVLQPVYNPTDLTLVTAAALRAAGNSSNAPIAQHLSTDQLKPLVIEAMARWAAVGANVESLAGVEYHITDLPGRYLALASPTVIWIDEDAAGFGWSVNSSAGMDLLTVIAHELGYLLRLEHTDLDDPTHGVMRDTLEPGIRRLPGSPPAASDYGVLATDDSSETSTVRLAQLSGRTYLIRADSGVVLTQEDAGRMDQITIILHEPGHLLGLEHPDSPDHAHDLMAPTLDPDAIQVDLALSGDQDDLLLSLLDDVV